jgi:predicted 3-demethylubiquinone-9 3-methyltransferase (glyoxalase superfamily)
MSQTTRPFLFQDGQAEAAMTFYTSPLPDTQTPDLARLGVSEPLNLA